MTRHPHSKARDDFGDFCPLEALVNDITCYIEKRGKSGRIRHIRDKHCSCVLKGGTKFGGDVEDGGEVAHHPHATPSSGMLKQSSILMVV